MKHPCYLCHTPMEFFMEKQGYKLYRCPVCKLTMTEFHKQYASFVKQFYSKGFFTGDPRRSAFSSYEKDKQCISKNLQQVLEKIKPFVHPGVTLLDAGCAMGFMVELARVHGYEAFGFDPSSYALSRASSEIKQFLSKATIETASYPKNFFDVITLTDIIEHVSNPIVDLQALRQFFKKDGLIVIATGDTQSIAAQILKKHWTFYIPPQHLFFLSKGNLTMMLRQAGFTPITWFRVGKWLTLEYVVHLAQSAGNYWWARYMHTVITWLRIGKLPIYLPMQDNMVVIAKKL